MVFSVENLFYLGVNLFRIYVIYRFARAFFEKTNAKLFELTVFSLYYLINSIAFLLFSNLLVNMVTNILPFFAITFLYKSKMFTKILVTFSPYVINMLLEVVFFTVFKSFNIGAVIITTGIASTLILFLIEMLFEHFSKFKGNVILNTTHLMAIILIPTSSVFIVILTMTQFNINTVLTSLTLLAINVTVFYLYDVLGRFYEEISEKSLLEQQNKAYINQLQLEDELHASLRFFKHDMENHFIKMKDLLIHENYQGLSDYLNACSEYVKPERKYSNSGNKDIDSLLNYKLREIGEAGADINIKINLPDALFVSMFDLIVILGNLVDNAVEELKKCEKCGFKVEIKCKKEVLFILVENTCYSEIKFENERINTSKLNAENHGLGLRSVKHTLNKYGGKMTIHTNDNVFTVKILLYNCKIV